MKKCLLLSAAIGIVSLMILCPTMGSVGVEVETSDAFKTEITPEFMLIGRFSEMGGIGSINFGNFPRVRWQKLGITVHLVIELDQKFEDHGWLTVNGQTYSHPDYTKVRIPIFFGYWKWDSSQSELLDLRGIGFGVNIK